MPFTGKSVNPSILAVIYALFSNFIRKGAKVAAACGLAAFTVCGAWSIASAQAKTATTTAIAVTSAGSAVTTVNAGTVVTLTATVNAGTTPVNPGQVNFCDASANYCTDVHLLGTAQLTGAGTAVLKFRPGIGSHSYKAVFLGTQTYVGGPSGTVPLAVTGRHATTTAIAQSGIVGAYTLTATVTGMINSSGNPAPTGSVSFVDTTNSNSVLGSAAVSSGTAGLSFSGSLASVTVPSGMGIATADFNGDGIPDLAVGAMNTNAAALSILLGNGDGTFTPVATNPVVGVYPYSVVVGDFNGDGIPDLAVGNVINSSVSILLGKGDGTFTAEPNLAIGSAPQSLVAADFNGDGIPDLAVVSGASVLVFIGKGDGTFQQATASLPAGTFPQGIAAGDLNGDGIVDLVVANDAVSGSVTIFLGNGDGTFKAGYEIAGTGNGTISVTIADLNGDGIPDLAVTNYDGSGGDSVSILLGKGNGTFQTPVPYGISLSNLQSVIAADFNGDGIPDLAIGSGYPASVAILPGKGDGTFGSPVYAYVSGLYPSGFIAVADFNGDGLPDIAEPDQISSTVGVFLNRQSQTVTATLNNVNPPGPGTHLVDASYPGDSNFGVSVSTTTGLTALVAIPIITPSSGTFTTVQTVTITDATPGATIYYWASGIVNTNAWVPYTAPIPLTTGGVETISAYATEAGYQESGTTNATFTLNLPAAPAPTFGPVAGSYASAQTVTISDSAPGATIYYTTNGTMPTANSAQYAGPITVSASETLAAVAVANGYSMSPLSSAQYFIGSSSTSFIYTVAGDGTYGYTGDSGQATLADLNYPLGSVLDSTGNLYIADSANNVVRKVAAGTGVITTVAGNGTAGYSGDNGPGASAKLSLPWGVAIDAAGNLYISDSNNSAIRKVAAGSGIITTIAGNGTPGYGGDNGPATSAQLSYPAGIAVDGAGNLYFVDQGNYRIREVSSGTGIITTAAGNGQYGYTGDGGFATSATLGDPVGVAADRAGDLYIADTYNNVVRKVTASTRIISTVAGTGPTGNVYHSGYSGDGGPATSAELYWPLGVAVDTAGNLYIADWYNQAIRRVATGSGIITTAAGNGSASPCNSLSGDGGPATNSALCFPHGVAVDSPGNFYIADSESSRIRKVTVSSLTPATTTAAPVFSVSAGTYVNPQTVTLSDSTQGAAIYLTMDGSTPSTLSPGYNGPINVTGTVTVNAVAVAPGYLPSAAVSAAYTITTPPTAIITTVAGNGVWGFSGAGGPALSAELDDPGGLALDGAGNIYFADTFDNVVWEISAQTGDIAVVAGNGTAGYYGDGGPATSAQLSNPIGVAVDSAGNIYIADSLNDEIRKVTAATGTISTIAGSRNRGGYPGNIGDGGPATAAFLNQPAGLALDSAGNLYIADQYNRVVRKIAASTGIITTVAGNGVSGFSGDGGPATSASFFYPYALAIDSAGNLYVSDVPAGRIRKVTASSGIIATVAGNGDQGGSSGDGGLATNAEIDAVGLAVGASGNLYASSWPGAVREISASTGIIGKVAGNGYSSFSGDGGSATVAGISGPQGIAFDAAGNLYIADAGNYRIRKVTFPGPATAPAFSLAAGAYTGAQAVTITDATKGATIFYTTDGSTPTTASNVYCAPIQVSTTETLQAIAVATGYTESPVTTAAYTINLPVTPTIIWPAPQPVTYGTALSATQLDASSAVAGTFVYTPAAGAVLAAGTQTLLVTFTPTDSTDYTTATATAQLTVNKATPIVTWAAPAGITNGTALSSTQLDATASVPGTFVYNPAAGTAPAVGNDTLSVTFTPNDITDYNNATASVTLVVTPPSNPVPVIGSISPAFSSAGGAAFTLTITGTGFASGSTAYWGTTALGTTFVSATQLSAQVAAVNIASAGTTPVTVQSPTSGAGTSNALQFEVDSAGSTSAAPTFTSLTANVAAGSTASYPVTLPSSATSVSVTCLNLPTAATCTYSSTTGAVTIATTSTTPAGTYQVTVVFTETLPGAVTAGILLPFLLLPLFYLRRRLAARSVWVTACLGLVLLAAAALSTGCGGGGGGSTTTPPINPTHQVTSSGTVSLTIH
jgi:sugar lactone lactonase YvrE